MEQRDPVQRKKLVQAHVFSLNVEGAFNETSYGEATRNNGLYLVLRC